MPKSSGRRDTRQLFPVDQMEVYAFVHSHLRPQWQWAGKACCIKEHEGRRVYAPDDNGELMMMAREGRLDSPFGMVQVKGSDRIGGLACPDCVNVILGLGRG